MAAREGDSRAQIDLGLVCYQREPEEAEGRGELVEPLERALFWVEWEVGDGEFLSEEQIAGRDSRCPELSPLPVLERTGLPLLALFTDADKGRAGEMALVLRATANQFNVRFVAAVGEGDEHGAQLRRGVHRVRRYLTTAHEVERCQFFAIERAELGQDMEMTDLVFDLLMEVPRLRVVARHPQCAADARLLASSHLLTDAAAMTFVGRTIHMALVAEGEVETRLFAGRVERCDRGSHGRVRFHLRFHDGDTVAVQADELIGMLAWAETPGSPRVVARGIARGTPRRPRARAMLSPTQAAPRASTEEGQRSSTAPLGEDSPRGGGEPRPMSAAGYGRAAHMAPASGGAPRSSSLAPRTAVPMVRYPGARIPGSAPAVRSQRRSRASSRSLFSRMATPSVLRSTSGARWREMRSMVLEGLDTRLTEEYQSTHSPRQRDGPSIGTWLDSRYGQVRSKPVRRRTTWAKADAEESAMWLRLVRRMKGVKQSTLRSYSSIRYSYEKHCESFTPPLPAYPLTAEVVGVWLLRRYSKKMRSNVSNTKPLISALTHHARHVLKLDTEVRPYPGMDAVQRAELHRVCLALGELEDMAVRRSIPLTAMLLRMMVAHLPPPPASPGQVRSSAPVVLDATRLRTLRDVARYNLTRVCMLRRDDCREGKLLAGAFRSFEASREGDQGYERDASRGRYGGRLLVAPGKSHRTEVWAEVPGIIESDIAGGWSDYVRSPGYALHQWMVQLRRLHGGTIPATAELFPEVRDDASVGTRMAQADAFLLTVRGWARVCGLPDSFCDRLTLHGFRSGGCSDAVNSGRATVQEIMRQGRWTSHCFEMYIHMHAELVRDTFRQVTCDASLTLSERASASAEEEKMKVLTIWRDEAMRESRTSMAA